ncbi:Copper homeostasis protein CutC [compost metagenome]
MRSALEGASVLAALVKLAAGRISIMPGAGINPQNIFTLQTLTGATTFHASARTKILSAMEYRNEAAKMGSAADEYQYEQTATELVRQLVSKLKP